MIDTLVLSPKYRDFLSVRAKREYLEGTTAAGKTTVGIFKFMLMVADNEMTSHIIAGTDLGTVEKNVINSELGLLSQFEGITEYYPNGKGRIRLPHISFDSPSGKKIIYISGFDDKARWKKVLGSQFGCVYIDEVNTADMEFLREITHRCRYMMTTSNPDAPDKPVYKEFINKSRPLKRYAGDYPPELLEELNEEPVKGYIHWYFTFHDNASLTEEEIQDKIDAVPKGTKMYKNKILGLRGKATGLVFCNFSHKRHLVSKEYAKGLIKDQELVRRDMQKEWFAIYTAGLDTAYSSKSPDTIAMSYLGITNKGRCFVLDEKVYNNASLTVSIAPSDTVSKYIEFLERNRKEWGGMAKNTFVDNADQATITEFMKYKRAHRECLYHFNDAYKNVTIIDRIVLQLGWMSFDDERAREPGFYVVDNCKNYIRELDNYSWKEDEDCEPEDANDHMVNSVQYAWIPYKDKIGEQRNGMDRQY